MAYVVLEKDATSTFLTSGISYPEIIDEMHDLVERFHKATGRQLDPSQVKVEAYDGGICIVYRGEE